MSAEGFARLREMAEGLYPLKDKAARQVAEERQNRKEPFYGKTPDRLSNSIDVSAEAIVLFSVLHGLSAEKQLASRPVVEVSLKELCRRRHRGETKVREWLKELQKAGWIDVLHRGVHKVNRYRLYESSLADRQGTERLESVRRKLRDPEVVKRLTKRPT